MCVCTHISILCNITFSLPQLTTAGYNFASVRFKVCSSKRIHLPCYSHKVLPAPLLSLQNCLVLSLLILHPFGSREFVDDGVYLGDGSCLEALPFSGAHKGVWYCQVPSHFAVQGTKGSQNHFEEFNNPIRSG